MKHTVISYLYDTVKRYAEKVVCTDENTSLSYQELWDKSDVVAGNLLSDSCSRKPIPVLMKKSCDVLSVMFGIIKAGCCYVIIDPLLPTERINSILNVLEAERVVVGEQRNTASIPEHISVLQLENLYSSITNEQKAQVEYTIDSICDTDPLYIMFTSGSTGVPKGVVVNHRSVMDFIGYFVEKFQITSEDVIGNQAPWDFDVSVKDIYSTIKSGATMQIIAKKYFSLPLQLAELLENKQVTILIWAVSALCILSSRNIFEYVKPTKIRKVIFSGEVMPVSQYNIWREQYPEAMFVNVYGPTEITCNCTYHILDREYGEDEVLPIGKPFPNERVLLLDENDRLIKEEMTNVRGEICVSGTAVTMGYYNAPEETGKHFVQNPLNKAYREIIYRTGDLAYYNEEKQLCFLGRKDFQIKHLGHRIELSEIERALHAIPGIRRSCCIYHEEEIVAFIEGNNSKEVGKELRKHLPAYMIPTKMIRVSEFSLNKNGKIDRTELIELLGRNNHDQ